MFGCQLLITVLVLLSNISSENQSTFDCQTIYSFAYSCKRFIFANDCQPWSLENCEPLVITRSDPRCPRYICVESSKPTPPETSLSPEIPSVTTETRLSPASIPSVASATASTVSLSTPSKASSSILRSSPSLSHISTTEIKPSRSSTRTSIETTPSTSVTSSTSTSSSTTSRSLSSSLTLAWSVSSPKSVELYPSSASHFSAIPSRSVPSLSTAELPSSSAKLIESPPSLSRSNLQSSIQRTFPVTSSPTRILSLSSSSDPITSSPLSLTTTGSLLPSSSPSSISPITTLTTPTPFTPFTEITAANPTTQVIPTSPTSLTTTGLLLPSSSLSPTSPITTLTTRSPFTSFTEISPAIETTQVIPTTLTESRTSDLDLNRSTSSRRLSTASSSLSSSLRSTSSTSSTTLSPRVSSSLSSTSSTNPSLAAEFLIEVSSKETETSDAADAVIRNGKENRTFDDFSPREATIFDQQEVNGYKSESESKENLTTERDAATRSQIEKPNLAFDLSKPFAGFVGKKEEQTATMVDCGNRTCQETYEELASCKLYVNDGEGNCHVPCNLVGCDVILRENVVCPVWHCTNKPIPPSPTPGPSPPSPSPSPTASFCSDTICISSVTANVVFFIFLAILVAWLIKKRRRQIQLANWLLNDEEAPRRSDEGDDRSIRTHSTTSTGIENAGAGNLEDVDERRPTLDNGASNQSGPDVNLQQDEAPAVSHDSGAVGFARCVQRHPLGLDANILAEDGEEESIALNCFSSKKSRKSSATN